MKFILCRNLFSSKIPFLNKKNIKTSYPKKIFLILIYFKLEKLINIIKNFDLKSNNFKNFFQKKNNKKIKKTLYFLQKFHRIVEFIVLLETFNFNRLFQFISTAFRFSLIEVLNFFFKFEKGMYEGWLSLEVFFYHFSEIFPFLENAEKFLKNSFINVINPNKIFFIYFQNFLKKFFWKKKNCFFFICQKIFILFICENDIDIKIEPNSKFTKKNSLNLFWGELLHKKALFFSKYLILSNFSRYFKVFFLAETNFLTIQKFFSFRFSGINKKKINLKQIQMHKFSSFYKNFQKKLLNLLLLFWERRGNFSEIFKRFFLNFFVNRFDPKLVKNQEFIKKNFSINKIFKIIKKNAIDNDFKSFFIFKLNQPFLYCDLEKNSIKTNKNNFKKLKKFFYLKLKVFDFFFENKISNIIFYLNFLIKLEFLEKFFIKIKKIYSHQQFSNSLKKKFFYFFSQEQIFSRLRFFQYFLFLKLQNFFFITPEQIYQNFFNEKNNNSRIKINKSCYLKKIYLIPKNCKKLCLSLLSIGNLFTILMQKIYQNFKNYNYSNEYLLSNLIIKFKNFVENFFLNKFNIIMLILEKNCKIFI